MLFWKVWEIKRNKLGTEATTARFQEVTTISKPNTTPQHMASEYEKPK